MRTIVVYGITICLCAICIVVNPSFSATVEDLRLIIVDPGHFHASLIQREMYPGISPKVTVYGSLGSELIDYLNRVASFNTRTDQPTRWELDIHTGAVNAPRAFAARAGSIAVFSGRNRGKIDRIQAALDAGVHVFADKPWIISSADMRKLEAALNSAERSNLAAYDIMTERFEITSVLQRELVSNADAFGRLQAGDNHKPAIFAKSVHNIMKVVAGLPLRRPSWFFDIDEYGEGLADVGTHVVDLVQWTAFPNQEIDYKKDIQVTAGRHWPIALNLDQYKKVTGEAAFPDALGKHVQGTEFRYFCNNSVEYQIKGSHVQLEIVWNWEAPPGTGDVYESSFRGTKSRVDLRQGAAEKHVPELYVVPEPEQRASVLQALRSWQSASQSKWPGVSIVEQDGEVRIEIPAKLRVGHESHFAQVANQFFGFVRVPSSLPKWEKNAMLAKYYVTTQGVELAKLRE